MVTKVQKWGNSLAVRIPKAIARELKAESGCEVTIEVRDGELVIAPVEEPHYTLEELLAGITPENLHEATDWGPPVGKELL